MKKRLVLTVLVFCGFGVSASADMLCKASNGQFIIWTQKMLDIATTPGIGSDSFFIANFKNCKAISPAQEAGLQIDYQKLLSSLFQTMQ